MSRADIRPYRALSWTDRSGSITTGDVARTIAAANPKRSYLLIQNISSGDLWIDFDQTAVQDQPSMKLAAGGSFVMESSFVHTGAVSIIGHTSGAKFVCKEGA